MSKALLATCEDGEVFCEGKLIEDCEIFSEGVGVSQGLLILDEDKRYYVAKTSPDLKLTLEKVIVALDNAADALNALDTAAFLVGVTGGAMTPAVGIPGTPVAASNISAINSAKADLEELVGELK